MVANNKNKVSVKSKLGQTKWGNDSIIPDSSFSYLLPQPGGAVSSTNLTLLFQLLQSGINSIYASNNATPIFADGTLLSNVTLSTTGDDDSLVVLTRDQLITELDDIIIELSFGTDAINNESNVEGVSTSDALNTLNDDISLINTNLEDINSDEQTQNTAISLIQSEIGVINSQVNTNLNDIDTINSDNFERDIKITKNSDDIETNKNDISINASNISSNKEDITTLQSDVVVNTSNIAVNKGNINTILNAFESTNSTLILDVNSKNINSNFTWIINGVVEENTYSAVSFVGSIFKTTTNLDHQFFDLRLETDSTALYGEDVQILIYSDEGESYSPVEDNIVSISNAGRITLSFRVSLKVGVNYQIRIRNLSDTESLNITGGNVYLIGSEAGAISEPVEFLYSSDIIDDYSNNPETGINVWKTDINTNKTDIVNLTSTLDLLHVEVEIINNQVSTNISDIDIIKSDLLELDNDKLDKQREGSSNFGEFGIDSVGVPYIVAKSNSTQNKGIFEVKNSSVQFYIIDKDTNEFIEYVPTNEHDLTDKKYVDNHIPEVDLSNYYTKTEVDTSLNSKVNALEGTNFLNPSYFSQNSETGIITTNFYNSGLETEATHGVDAINEINTKLEEIYEQLEVD